MSRRVTTAAASLMMSLSVLMVISTDPVAAATPSTADHAHHDRVQSGVQP